MISGYGEVLPDRALLPRRGPARRSAVRVHPDRPRDVLPDRGGRLRRRRGVSRGRLCGRGDRGRAPVPPTDLRGGDGAVRHGPPGPALRPSAGRSDRGGGAGSGFAPFEKALSAGRHGARPAGARGAACSRKKLDELAARWRTSTGPRGWSGSRRPPARSRSPAKKALPEAVARAPAREGGDVRGRPAPRRRRPREGGLRRAGRPSRRRRAGAQARRRVEVRFLLGDGFSAARVRRDGRRVVSDEPSVHRAPRGGSASSRDGARPRAGPGLRRRRQRLGARLRIDPHPSRGRAGACLPPPRDLRRGGPRALRLPARRAPLRRAAARWHRARPRPHLRDRCGRVLASRGDCVPEDDLGHLPDDAGSRPRSAGAVRGARDRAPPDPEPP